MKNNVGDSNSPGNSPKVMQKALLASIFLLLSTGAAFAHVALDDPNGGEVLEVDSVHTVAWHDVVAHGPADYDLWYSTSGPDGPWIEIISNLNGYTYDWTVPDTPSNQVRVRVLFLTENGRFRSNLGLVNGVNSPITLEWELFANDGTSLGTDLIDLPPWGNVQLNRILADFSPIEAAYVEVWTTTSGGVFTCYGSVLD